MEREKYDKAILERDKLMTSLEEINKEIGAFDYKCIKCKFMGQGEFCPKCFNPKQTEQHLKDYVYYNSGCRWFEPGTALTDKEIESLGYYKISETEHFPAYFKKKDTI